MDIVVDKEFCEDINEILPFLYISNETTANNTDFLKK